MGTDLHFHCDCCGDRIREFDRKTYINPEERETVPLRMVLEKRRKIAGVALCDTCWGNIMKGEPE